MTHDQERAISVRLFSEPCMGRNDKYHGGNCAHCCIRGDGMPNTADGKGLEPNYAGWGRIYVQAGRIIPARFAAAFLRSLESENTAYAGALKEDIVHFGVEIEGEKS